MFEKPLYFEMHVSVDHNPENEQAAKWVEEVKDKFALKHSIITGDEPDHILTRRFSSFNEAVKTMSMVQTMLGPNLVTRAKIEAAVIDFHPKFPGPEEA